MRHLLLSTPALAVGRALLFGACLGAPLATPAPAVAQAQEPERTVFGIRFLGDWLDDYGLRYTFTDKGLGRLEGRVTNDATGALVATLDWRPTNVGMGGNFTVPHQNPSERASDRGITGYVNHEGRAAMFVRAGVFPNDHKARLSSDEQMRQALGLPVRGYDFNLHRPAGQQPGGDVPRWSGRWRTTRGLMDLRPDGANLFGNLYSDSPDQATERLAVLGAAGGTAVGAWERDGPWSATVDRGDLVLRLSPDGRSFSGWYTDVNRPGAGRTEWRGERVDQPQDAPAGERPAPQPAPAPPPSVPPPAAPTPAPTPVPVTPAGPAPASTAAFKPLRRFDVRLDRVVEARGYPTRQVHAFVTVKNASAQPMHATSGFLTAVLTDSDGVAQQRSQIWRASGEPAALFNSTPVIAPGAELTIRYVFIPDNGSRPARFSLSEGDTSAEFPVSGF